MVGSERAVRIDATSLAVDDVTKQLQGDLPLAFAGGRLWARTADAGLASFTPDLDDRRLYDVPGQVFPDAAVVNDDVYVAYGGSSGGASTLLRIDTTLDKPTSVVKLPAGRSMEYGIDSDGACLWVPLVSMHEVYRACPTA